MILKRLSILNYKNIRQAELAFSPKLNCFIGHNGVGKTNLLEACWLFTGARSFRGAKDSEMVGFGKDGARLGLKFHAGKREQEAAITYGVSAIPTTYFINAQGNLVAYAAGAITAAHLEQGIAMMSGA